MKGQKAMRIRLSIYLAVATLGVLSVIGSSSSYAQPVEASYVKGQVLVKFKAGSDKSAVAATQRASLGEAVGDTGVHVLNVSEGAEKKVMAALNRNKNVEFVELNGFYTAATTDVYFKDQWALENTGQGFVSNGETPVSPGIVDSDIDAPEAWAVSTGAGIKVAVVDSGVDVNHPDLVDKVVAAKNFSGARSGVDDIYGHGTHVAGTIAANHNDMGIAGVCPDCTILNAKVLNDSGSGSFSAIAKGISWSSQQGAKVINMSLGSVSLSKTIETAINNAWSKGAVLVAAAGNDMDKKVYPGAYDKVIAVAATDNKDEIADFSLNYKDSWVDIAAPGVNVYGTFPCHPFALQKIISRALCYDVANGTSMSSPNVAGVVALAWSKNATASNVEVREKVLTTTDSIPETILGTITYGRVNAASAVKW